MRVKTTKLTPKDKEELYLSENDLGLEKYLNEIAKKYSEDTIKNTEGIFQKIGKEADKLLKEVQIQKEIMKTEVKYWQQQGLSIDTLNRRFSKDKRVFLFEATLKKCYAFIQQIRKAFTQESLEYLILFDESMSGKKGEGSKESKIGKFTLSELLPAISLSIDQNEKDILNFSLRINKQDSLKNLYNKIEDKEDQFSEVSKKIIENYIRILNLRFARYQRFKKRKERLKNLTKEQEERLKKIASKYFTSRGFSFEEAVLAIVNDWTSDFDLITKYKQDTEAFWRGGDLKWAAGEIPSQLVQNRERINLELKRVSATAENSIGAGLVSVNSIETALIAIKNILLNKKLQKTEAKEALEMVLFKAKKNIRKDVAEKIANLAFYEIKELFKQVEDI